METMTRMSTDCEHRLVDRAAVLDRVGGDEELLREITCIFLTEYPRLIDEIRSAVDSRDAKRLERAAHSLKGSVSNFGAQAATEAAYRLEIIGSKLSKWRKLRKRSRSSFAVPTASAGVGGALRLIRFSDGHGAIVASFAL